MANALLVRLGKTIVLVGFGILSWFYFRGGQANRVRTANRDGLFEQAHVVRVPSWLSRLCGSPLPDNQLELVFTICQMGILIWGLVGGLALLLARNSQQMIQVLATIGMALLAVTLIVQVGASLLKKISARRREQ